MDIGSRRVLRLALTMALALAGAYAFQFPLPYIAPIFAFLLTAAPKPPPAFKGLVVLVLVLSIIMGLGLLLIPVLREYPFTGLLLVAVGLFVSNIITVNLGKTAPGMLLTVGFTMITAAGTIDFGLALMVIQALVLGVSLTVICQWIVYPFFPEDAVSAKPAPRPRDPAQFQGIALRSTLIVLPAYFLVLTNPAAYMPVMLKSVALSQQGSLLDARHAGRELLGSTFLAGLLAIVFWFCLKLSPTLWMFFLWTLLFGIFLAGKFYGVFQTWLPPTFWQNVVITLLILVGPAVEDTANGKDPYVGFAVRMSLFIGVTLYAWLAIYLLAKPPAKPANPTSEANSVPC